MSKTYNVKVKAPPRERYAGFWSAQRFFPNAQLTELKDVSGRELKELLADDAQGFILVEGADDLREQLKSDPDAGVGGQNQVVITDEELQQLNAIRAQKQAGTATLQVPVSTKPADQSEQPKGKGGK
jgi:hypothetical protein